jgi:dTMP kinase
VTGRYVALEGIEGAGKSTVATALAEHLRGRGVEVVAVREPGGTSTGERIRRMLLDPDGTVDPWSEALLFAAARAQLAAETVGPALRAGRWVVSDRSVYSSLAYQGGGRSLGLAEVRTVNELGLRGVWPQLVVLLRVDPAVGFRREAVRDRIGSDGIELQVRVSRAFDTLADAEPDRFAVVDASQGLDAVVARVCEIVEARWMTSTET